MQILGLFGLLIIIMATIRLATLPMIVTTWGLRMNGATPNFLHRFRREFGWCASTKTMLQWIQSSQVDKRNKHYWLDEILCNGDLNFVISLLRYRPFPISIKNVYYRVNSQLKFMRHGGPSKISLRCRRYTLSTHL